MVVAEPTIQELVMSGNERKFIETLLVVENKARQRVPFIYNPIQADADETETGMDVWVKPSQVGFSTERIAKRLVNTLTHPGTNTVLVAYEDFITERLLAKVNFFYNHLESLRIPGFPVVKHDSTYEKTYKFIVDGRTMSTSSIYIASARSRTAGRAEVIHHLLLDEHAFYVPDATERIIAPAMARVPPPDGTVDSFSTCNGEENDFHDWYVLAREGRSVFTAHFYTWYMHPEYVILLGDSRINQLIPETDKPEFRLSQDEERLVCNCHLTFDQIRWRRWMILVMESLKRRGETRTLFLQEFPEDDISCFLSTGDMYYDNVRVDELAKGCYPAPKTLSGLNIWFGPEKDKHYLVTIDPGQAKITQSAVGVLRFDADELGNTIPVWCARDAGLYSPEVTARKAVAASDLYGRAMITWEANAHGLAVTELLKKRRPIYMRRDIVSGYQSMEPGWLTTPKTKEYMFQAVHKFLPDLVCHDIELVGQFRNLRQVGDKVQVVGADDIHDSLAIGLVCRKPYNIKRGYQGRSGWNW